MGGKRDKDPSRETPSTLFRIMRQAEKILNLLTGLEIIESLKRATDIIFLEIIQ